MGTIGGLRKEPACLSSSSAKRRRIGGREESRGGPGFGGGDRGGRGQGLHRAASFDVHDDETIMSNRCGAVGAEEVLSRLSEPVPGLMTFSKYSYRTLAYAEGLLALCRFAIFGAAVGCGAAHLDSTKWTYNVHFQGI